MPTTDGKILKIPYKLYKDNHGPCLVKGDFTKDFADFDTIDAARRGWEHIINSNSPLIGKRGPETQVYLGVTALHTAGVVAFDFDKCVAPTTGDIDPSVLRLVIKLASYTEITPSGTGLRTFIKGTVPPETRRKKNNLEIFHYTGYVTVTGNHLPGTPTEINSYNGDLNELLTELGFLTAEPTTHPNESQVQPVLLHPMAAEQDDLLVHNMLGSRRGDSIRSFFEGGEPADLVYDRDASAGDFHFAQVILWWNAGDEAQAERLMRKSVRYRDKWDTRHHGHDNPPYLQMTIQNAKKTLVDFKGNFDDLVITFGMRKVLPEGYTYDSVGMANRFADLYKGDFIATDDANYVWTGKYWKQACPSEVNKMLLDVGDYVLLNEQVQGEDKFNTMLKRLIKSFRCTSGLKDFLTCVRNHQDIYVPESALDRDSMLLPFQNGIVDLTTGQYVAHEEAKSRYITRMLPYEYDPEADCPRWRGFIEAVTGGTDDFAVFLQDLAGMCTTDVFVKQFYMLVGPKDTGKSTFIEVVSKALAAQGQANAFATSVSNNLLALSKQISVGNPTTELVKMEKKRMVHMAEVSGAYILNEPMVKQLTGGDTLSVRALYKNSRDMHLQCTLLMHGNSLPVVRGVDDAIWDRLVIVPFTNSVVKASATHLQSDLAFMYEEELPGIMAWMVQGAMRFAARGFVPPELPAEMVEIRKEHRENADSVDQFVQDKCLLGGGSIRSTDLWNAYRAWCKLNDYSYTNRDEFNNELRELGCQVGARMVDDQGRKLRVVTNITLREPFDNVQITVGG